MENEQDIMKKLEDDFDKLFEDVDPADEELDNIVTLVDEDGEEIRFEFLDLIAYDGNQYVVLYPVDNNAEPGKVLILMLKYINGKDESYVNVEDDDILSAVFKIFKSKFKKEFNFED